MARDPLAVGPWEVLGRLVPARQVGGDLFDYYVSEGGRLCVVIADVSGKGVPAAVRVAYLRASVRVWCTGILPISLALREVNRSLIRSTSAGQCIAFFYGEADFERGVFHYGNAGHPPPLLRRRDGAILQLEESGPHVGSFEESTFGTCEVRFAPGDSLLLYSDGIPDVFDTRGVPFGDARLLELWRALGGLPAGDAMDLLLYEVDQFRGSASQSDDITAVVVGSRREP